MLWTGEQIKLDVYMSREGAVSRHIEPILAAYKIAFKSKETSK